RPPPLPSHWLAHLHAPHPFPTRRSSDLMLNKQCCSRIDTLCNIQADCNLAFLFPQHCPNRTTPDKSVIAHLHPVKNLHDKSFKKDRKSTRLNSSHVKISYAVFCLRKKTS